MSSCFLCDTSYKMTENDRYDIVYAFNQSEKHFMKYMPIIIGSTGINKNDQQHENSNGQNYVSYRVKKIEFQFNVDNTQFTSVLPRVPDYVVLFKVPFSEPIFPYYFILLKEFILFSKPECVLKYGVYSRRAKPINVLVTQKQKHPNKYDLIVNKPFVVGPNDYVGVFYMFYDQVGVESSAKVWFDVL